MKKISIIIPAYNVEKFIGKCLDSLINQTLEDIEVIVVDDGSTDSTGKILDEYSKQYKKKIKVIHKINEDVSIARNTGLKLASGEYIGYVDSDDYIEPTMYEEMYSLAIKDDLDMVICDAKMIYPTKEKIVYNGINKKNDFLKLYTNEYPVIWNKIYKRSVIKNITFRDKKRYEDIHYLYKVYPKIKSFDVIEKPLYNYIQHSSSITYTFDKRLYHIIENMDDIIDTYKKDKIYKKYKNEIEYSYVRYLYATFIKRLSKQNDKSEFKDGVKYVIKKVNKAFPNYKKNKYLKKNNLKNVYLKTFNSFFAYIIYFIERKKMN